MKPSSLRVVPMERRHIPRLAELERLCFAQPWSAEALKEELENPHAFFLAAEWEGQTAGYIGLTVVLDEGYIANVAVDPDLRRRGIGRGLIRAAKALGREKGLSFLSLEVRPSNAGALALYEGEGFQAEGRRRQFYSHPAEDGLILTYRFEQTREKGDGQ